MPLKVILASSSKSRKNILSILKIPFQVISSDFDEEKIQSKNPRQLISRRAKAKGEAVEKIITAHLLPPALIIAADSMVVYDNKAYGKAADINEAKKYLTILSGHTHAFLTAVWIKNTSTQKISESITVSKVTLKKMTTEEISWYAAFDDLTKYAGAYSLFDSPQTFITKIEGSLTNIIGLPLEIVIPILKENSLL